MIVDTSVIIAILREETEAADFIETILNAPQPCMSVASYLEASLRLGRLDVSAPADQLDKLLEGLNIKLEPVTIDQAHIACKAGRRYGKGHHRAALNFGDCLTYALAKSTGKPLLFKGNDFGQTDIDAARIKAG